MWSRKENERMLVSVMHALVMGEPLSAHPNLLDSVQDVDSFCDGTTALTVASRLNRLDWVRALLAKGADPNRRTWDLAAPTAIVDAATEGNLEVVEALLSAGAVPNIVNGEGLSLVALAERSGLPDEVVAQIAALVGAYPARSGVVRMPEC